MGFYHLPLEVEVPCATDPQRGHLMRYRLVVGLMKPYKGIRAWTLLHSFFSHVRVWQPRGSAAREGDDVMAAGQWPGK
jgi:hypothetical protein